jgi:hypothetical protein
MRTSILRDIPIAAAAALTLFFSPGSRQVTQK